MSSTKNIIITLLVVFSLQTTKAQHFNNNNKNWFAGIGLNTVNDSGESLSDIFNLKTSYQFSNPFKVSLERKFSHFNGVELRATTNKYKKGKKFNETYLTDNINFFSIDASYKYYFHNKENTTDFHKISAYVLGGLGITWLSNENDPSIHIGGGINYNISENIILNFQSVAKLSVSGTVHSNNYLQFDFGVIFPFTLRL